jgi:Protein of unknown function (DUF2817)
MHSIDAYFSPDFATARGRFREAVAAQHGRLDSLKLSGAAPAGEDLTIDVGWFGAPNPTRALVHSSGLHGVEGYAGAAIQLQWLMEGIPALPNDAAIAIVHVLNPYGYAWIRRVNENNVDLNRNFRAPGDDGVDSGHDYTTLDALLNPQSVPRRDFFHARAAWLIFRHGMSNLRQAVAGGQRVNPRGLFYAGTQLEPGPALYQAYLQEKLVRAKRIVAIDVHTGLGRHGEDTLLVDAAPARARVNQTMRKTFGERTQIADVESIAYRVHGSQHDMYYRLFPESAVHFATQEFGTYHALRVLAALRAENRWHQYGSGSCGHPSKRRMMEVFCPRDDAWREKVLSRGRTVANQACALAFENDGRK